VPGTNEGQKELSQKQQLWTTQKALNYRYTLENSCFCIPEATQPVSIEVRDGERISIKAVKDGSSVNEEYFAAYDTIPKLFDLLQAAYNKKANRISVSFDPKLGFPTRIFIDFAQNIADEEIRLDIYGFEMIR
jgi:hypothetical protein